MVFFTLVAPHFAISRSCAIDVHRAWRYSYYQNILIGPSLTDSEAMRCIPGKQPNQVVCS
ncbi:hypothetical protein ACS0TY_010684 [Phlomoides rotata]